MQKFIMAVLVMPLLVQAAVNQVCKDGTICYNGGTCTQMIVDPWCKCPPNYFGTDCSHPCPENYSYSKTFDVCWVLGTNPRNYNVSRAFCRVQSHDLAYAATEAHMTEMAAILKPPQGWVWYVGARRLRHRYVWDKNFSEPVTVWGEGQPDSNHGDEDCVTWVTGYGLHNYDCTLEEGYICEFRRKI